MPGFRGLGPGAANDRAWLAAVRLHDRQRPAHGGDVDTHSGQPGRRRDQQFTRSTRPVPAVLIGRAADDAVQPYEEAVVELGLAIVLAGIPQAPLAVRSEASGNAADSGVIHAQYLGGLVDSERRSFFDVH